MAASHAPGRGVKFLGSYQYQLDEKGRVSLPAAFRREAADQSFVLIQAYPPALSLYPEGDVAAGGGAAARSDQASTGGAHVRVVDDGDCSGSGTGQSGPDSDSGSAEGSRQSWKGQVMLVGAIDKVEIWNPAHFQQAMHADAQKFAQFAPQIFR